MRVAVVLVAVLAWSSVAQADDEELPETLVERSQKCRVTVCIPGEYQFRYLHLGDFGLDPAGTKHGVVDRGEQRWRLRPRVSIGSDVYIEAEADLLTGQIFGDTTDEGATYALEPGDRLKALGQPQASDFRQLYVSWTSRIGLFRIGQQSSRFGLGLVANDGADEAHDVFDDPRLGDLAERALFITKPLKLFMGGDFADALLLIGGFDVVFRDDNANLPDGDLAYQGIVSLVYRTEPFTAGVYVAIRNQEDDDGDSLKAKAYDVYVNWVERFPSIRAKLHLSAELALVSARTDRVIHDQALDGVDVLGAGGALQSSFELEDLGLDTRLELGYASGDNDANDDLVRSFKFDPGYHVGMILFQEVMARVSAHAVTLASDQTKQAEPQKGVELVATNGSITNAWYINPVLRWKSSFGLRLDVGALVAWSVADFVDPFQSKAKNGGFNTNYLGSQTTSHALGVEVDGGIAYAFDIRDMVRLQVGAQVGAFFPGDAFEAPAGVESLGTVAKVRTTFDIHW